MVRSVAVQIDSAHESDLIETPDAAIRFDPVRHEYYLRGVKVPGVTKVLSRLVDLAGIPADVLANARDRGSTVHQAISLDLDNELDDTTVDARIMPYVNQFRLFRRAMRPKSHYNEHVVYSERHGFAGQLDFLGELSSLRHDELALIDWKTCVQIPVTVGPQTAAYEMAAVESLKLPAHIMVKRYALKLSPDAFRLVPQAKRDDRTVFLSTLNIMRWADANRC